MKRIFVRPRKGIKVRTEDGRGHIGDAGHSVRPTRYYRRRILAGDLVRVSGMSQQERLIEAIRNLDPDDPGHWTSARKPDLNYLTDVLNRRVSRKEVDEALKAMES
jgi:hypothetical protein